MLVCSMIVESVSRVGCDCVGYCEGCGDRSTGGLVGYDAAFTRLRSRVRFPLGVRFNFWSYH